MPKLFEARFFALIMVLTGLLVGTASATPIQPKLEDVIKQIERPRIVFPAARAGWNGPEQSQQRHSLNMLLEQYGPEGSARAVKASLIEVARPDVRAFIAIGMIILLLRILRSREQKRLEKQATRSVALSNQPITASAAHESDQ